MEKRKKLVAITVTVCVVIAAIIAIICIAVSKSENSAYHEDEENKRTSSGEENTSWFENLFGDDSTASEETTNSKDDESTTSPEETTNTPEDGTTAAEETTAAPEPEVPMIDLLSALIENNISYYGADGFGCIEINMSGEANTIISTAGTASLVYTGTDADHFILKDGTNEIVLRVTATPSEGLKTGDIVTLNADTDGIDTYESFGYRIAPITVTVPELGMYITDVNLLSGDNLITKVYKKDLTQDYKGFLEGALVHSAYIAVLNLDSDLWQKMEFDGKWKPNVSPAIVVVAVNPAYSSPCRIIVTYNIRTFADSDEWYSYYGYVTRENSTKTTFTISEAEEALATYLKDMWTLTPIENLPPVSIESDGRLQVEPLKDVVGKLIFRGTEGNGELILPALGDIGTIIHTAECTDGDYYFITDSDDGLCIKVVQNNKMIAEFKWGASRYTDLSEGDTITLGFGLAGDSPIQTFEELPFQFIPTTFETPELAKLIKSIYEVPSGNEIVTALGNFDGQWPSVHIKSYSNSWYADYQIEIDKGAEVVKVYLMELKPQYTLNEALETNFCLFVCYKHPGSISGSDFYYGAIYYDLWLYPNGNIRAKYFDQVRDAFGTGFFSLSGLESEAFDDYGYSFIDREQYNITVLYE